MLVAVVVMFVAGANLAVAADIPMRLDWTLQLLLTPPDVGVYSDFNLGPPVSGDTKYENGENGMQVYLGVGGKNVVLFTYQTTRTLHFETNNPFSPEENARWTAAGLPARFNAEVVSYFQPKVKYQSMKRDQVVTAKGQIEFQYGGLTYTLRYTDLAVRRIGTSNTWRISSFPGAPDGLSTTWHRAILSILRNGGHEVFGWVGMPIRFEATILE